jgi:hypothetical protein
VAIFLSYRRGDSLAIAGRIDDHLRAEFGDEDVFRDLEDIPLGTDFVVHLESILARCDVLLAIIGHDWLCARLKDDTDLLRNELETALSRGIPTIPVLVDGAKLPAADALPPSLRPLVLRQTFEIESGSDFKSDMARLIAGLRKLRRLSEHGAASSEAPLAKSRSIPPHRSPAVGYSAAGLVLALGTVWFTVLGSGSAPSAISSASTASDSAPATPQKSPSTQPESPAPAPPSAAATAVTPPPSKVPACGTTVDISGWKPSARSGFKTRVRNGRLVYQGGVEVSFSLRRLERLPAPVEVLGLVLEVVELGTAKPVLRDTAEASPKKALDRPNVFSVLLDGTQVKRGFWGMQKERLTIAPLESDLLATRPAKPIVLEPTADVLGFHGTLIQAKAGLFEANFKLGLRLSGARFECTTDKLLFNGGPAEKPSPDVTP